MNCYFTCQRLSKFSKTCFTTTKETALAPINLAHPVGVRGKVLQRWHGSGGNFRLSHPSTDEFLACRFRDYSRYSGQNLGQKFQILGAIGVPLQKGRRHIRDMCTIMQNLRQFVTSPPRYFSPDTKNTADEIPFHTPYGG